MRLRNRLCEFLKKAGRPSTPQEALDTRLDFPENVEQMPKDFLSDLEAICLAAVLNCGENAYGMTIHEEVERIMAGLRAVVIGTVYVTLDRLEEKGFVRSWFGGATAERGQRSKRYFEITASGQTALKNSYKLAGRTFDGAEKWGWS